MRPAKAAKSPAPVRNRDEIETMIARIEADKRNSYPPASTFENAPLALIQVELKAQVSALRWAIGLDKEIATSAAPERKKA